MSTEFSSHGTPAPAPAPAPATATTSNDDEIKRDTLARRLTNSRVRVALFKGLQDKNRANRAVSLDTITNMVGGLCREAEIDSEVGSPMSHRGSMSGTDVGFIPQDPSSGPSPNSAGTPVYPDREGVSNNILADEEARLDRNEQLQHYLLTALRLSQSCPYRDVRSRFRTLLRRIRRKHGNSVRVPMSIYSGPSFFISPDDLYSLDFADEDLADLPNSASSTAPATPTTGMHLSSSQTTLPLSLSVQADRDGDRNSLPSSESRGHEGWGPDSDSDSDASDHTSKSTSSTSSSTSVTSGRPAPPFLCLLAINTYLQRGRISNMFRVLSYFPAFLERHEKVIAYLLRTPSAPLPRHWRNYVAIMAAAGKGCQYLVSLQKHEFLQHGGNPNWLRGLAHAHPKIRSLASLARILAVAPWTLTSSDIAHLRRPSPSTEPGLAWTASELVHAVAILACFHSLSGFVLACGVVPEPDTRGGYYLPAPEDGGSFDYWRGGVEAELVGEESISPAEEDIGIRSDTAVTATGWDAFEGVSLMTPVGEGPQGMKARKMDIGKGLGVTVGDPEEEGYFGGAEAVQKERERREEREEEKEREEGEGENEGEEEGEDDEDEEDEEEGEDENEMDPKLVRHTHKVIEILRSRSAKADQDEDNSGSSSVEEPDQTRTVSFDSHSCPGSPSRRTALTALRSALSDTGASRTYRSATGTSTPSSTISARRRNGPRRIRPNAAHEDLSRFLDSDLPPLPATARGPHPTQLDYAWEDYGCDFASKCLPDLDRLINEELAEARQHTDWTLFDARDEIVDTAPLRNAIWCHALQLTGVEHGNREDPEANSLLSARTKAYIRKVLERPAEVKRSDWNDMGMILRSEERCHVNLLVVEARKLAELGFGVGAVLAWEVERGWG